MKIEPGTTYVISPDVEIYGGGRDKGTVLFSVGDSSTEMDLLEFRQTIINMVRALSYLSDDPEEVLTRFNVKHEDRK